MKTRKQRVAELEAEIAELRMRLDPGEVERQASVMEGVHQRMLERSAERDARRDAMFLRLTAPEGIRAAPGQGELRDTIEQLRALIQQVEWIDEGSSLVSCAWCGGPMTKHPENKHATDCPAAIAMGWARAE